MCATRRWWHLFRSDTAHYVRLRRWSDVILCSVFCHILLGFPSLCDHPPGQRLPSVHRYGGTIKRRYYPGHVFLFEDQGGGVEVNTVMIMYHLRSRCI